MNGTMTGIKKNSALTRGWNRIRSSLRGRALCVLFVAAAAAGGALYLYYHSPYEYPLPCVYHLLTGLYCPGCGAGRACYFLLHGQIAEAFSYNPLMVIFLPFFGVYVFVRVADWVITGKNHVDEKMNIKLLLGILVVIFLYGVVRNIPVFPLTLLAPGGLEQI